MKMGVVFLLGRCGEVCVVSVIVRVRMHVGQVVGTLTLKQARHGQIVVVHLGMLWFIFFHTLQIRLDPAVFFFLCSVCSQTIENRWG